MPHSEVDANARGNPLWLHAPAIQASGAPEGRVQTKPGSRNAVTTLLGYLFATAAALTACGGGGGGSDAPSPTAPPSTSPSPTPAPAPQPGPAPGPAPSPAPTPAPAPAPAGSAAALCGGLDFFFTAGNRAQVSFNVTGSPTGTEDWTATTVGSALFDGQDSFEVDLTIVPTIPGSPTVTVFEKQFAKLTGPTEVTVFGLDQQLSTSANISRVVNKPPFVDRRWELAAGQSMQQSFHAEAQSVDPSNGNATVISSFDENKTVTFAGVETVTVPAGTFPACRFDQKHASGGSDTQWSLIGTGVVVRMQLFDGTGAVTLERRATKVLINGSPP